MIVKRIAALPGDFVFTGRESLILPDACYYLLGDNREESRDSRHWKVPFVKEADIVARVVLL